MYRFLLTPRWVGLAALTLALAAVMGALGSWQWSRYQERSAINDRIDASATARPMPVDSVLTGTARPPESAAWTRVTATGRYDLANEIMVRGRTIEGRVGYEVLTPLVLTGGSAVLVDRGWVEPGPGGAAAPPPRVPAPDGEVTVIGRVHLTESRPGPLDRRAGVIEVRRISVPQLAAELPYPLAGAYLLLDEQTPPGIELVPIPVRHENAWQNAGYTVQWWLLAGLTLACYGWLARREARGVPVFGAPRRDSA